MGVKISYIISVFIFLLGLVLLFYYPTLGVLSLVLAFVIPVIQYFLQKSSDRTRDQQYQQIATLILDSAEAEKKIDSLKDIIKKKNISINKFIEKFDKPIYSIFIYKFNEVPRGEKNPVKLLTEHMLKNLKFQLISNSFYVLPPKEMPTIDEKFDIELWTKENIISKLPKDTTYTLNFVALVDLRKIFSYKNVQHGITVFDILIKDTKFLETFLRTLKKEKISLAQIIKDFFIGDIVTIKVDGDLIQKLNKNSYEILNKINCKDVTEICDVPISNLKETLSIYVSLNLDEITTNILENSKALKDVC